MSLLVACTAGTDQGPGATSDQTPRDVSTENFTPPPREIVTEPPGDWFETACSMDIELMRRVRRGTRLDRSPDIIFVPREPNSFGGWILTTHSGPQDYLQKVPIVFYGPGHIKPAGDIELDREVTVADIAPTVAELLGIPFPKDRPGRAIDEALLPEERRAEPPRLVFTVVWDGGGWNVLDEWPDAWPHLKSLMEGGTSVTEAIVGSSPSVTPATHTNIGTGAFPRQHGIVDIPVRIDGNITGSFRDRNAQYLLLDTLADIYDPLVGNAAEVGLIAYKMWHAGMLGHGSLLEGADKDILALIEKSAKTVTNDAYYSLPSYLDGFPGFDKYVEQVDASDGQRDGKWMGHDVLSDVTKLRGTPVWVPYQTDMLTAMIKREGFGADEVPDLLFTNYKQVDEVGHSWNMIAPEMEQVLEYSDKGLQDLTEMLDEEVGKDRWVVIYTADHGQQPLPESVGGWPIAMGPLQESVAAAFDMEVEELFLDERPTGFWLDRDAMAAKGVEIEEVADFLTTYRLKDNVPADKEIPEGYLERADELLFTAAWPTEQMGRLWGCSKKRHGA